MKTNIFFLVLALLLYPAMLRSQNAEQIIQKAIEANNRITCGKYDLISRLKSANSPDTVLQQSSEVIFQLNETYTLYRIYDRKAQTVTLYDTSGFIRKINLNRRLLFKQKAKMVSETGSNVNTDIINNYQKFMKNKKLLLAAFAMVAGLCLLLSYSCSDYKFEESNQPKNPKPSKIDGASNSNMDAQTTFDIGEVINFESRYNSTTKVKLEIKKVKDNVYNVRKWVNTIPESDPLGYSTLILGGEILSSSDNDLIVNLPTDKVFKQVKFDPTINDPTAIQLGGWDFKCFCCTDPGNGGSLPTGFGMCKVTWGYVEGALLVNCLLENCITGCGMEAGPVGGTGGTQIPLSIILDAAEVNIELMQ